MKKITASASYIDGCIIEKNYFFVSTRLDAQRTDDYDHGRLKWFHGSEAYYQDRGWQVSSVCVLSATEPKKSRMYVALEEGSGIVGFCVPGKQGWIDEVLPGAEDGHGIPSLTHICQIGKNLYVCGYGGKVMRRIDGRWEAFDKGLKALGLGDYLKQGMPLTEALKADELTQRDMNAIDGFSEQAIFCVGRVGLIFHSDGNAWHQIEKPTNVDLNCVHCAEDGFVYAAGNKGILVQGKGDRFHVLHAGVHDDFYAVTWFNGHLYVGGTTGLYRLERDALHHVDTGQGSFSCQALDSKDGQLLVVAERWLCVFDGTSWKRIHDPDNA